MSVLDMVFPFVRDMALPAGILDSLCRAAGEGTGLASHPAHRVWYAAIKQHWDFACGEDTSTLRKVMV